MRTTREYLRAIPWVQGLLWLALAAIVLLLLQLAYYAGFYLLLALQLAYYELVGDSCVTIGWLGVEHHWPARWHQWRYLVREYCSASDLPSGVVKEQVWLLDPQLRSLTFATFLLAGLVAVWWIDRRTLVGSAGGTSPWKSTARRTLLGAMFVLLAICVPGIFQLDDALDRISGPDDFSNAKMVIHLQPPFVHIDGLAYFASAPQLNEIADTMEQPTRSPALLFENNELIGPAHTLHAEIAKLGSGRFSHWGPSGGVIFSSPSGKFSETGGKVYWLVVPKQ